MRSIRFWLVVGIIGVLVAWYLDERFQWTALSANAFTELISILVTVLVIEWLNERRSQRELKAQLIREMGSTSKGIAVRMARELRKYGLGFGKDR